MSYPASFALFALLAASPQVLRADFNRETGSYIFRNYTANNYGAAPDSYQVVQDARGIVWVANLGAVLEFDGLNWSKIPVPGGSEVRSLAIDAHQSIFVGATGDFGQLIPDSTGTMRFHSLLSRVPQQDRKFGAVWRVLASPQGIYFSAYERLFRLNTDGSVKVWRPQSTFGRAVFVAGSLYVKAREVGLLQMRDDQLLPVAGGEIFTKAGVEDAASYAGGALIAAPDRLYRLTAAGIKPFPSSGESWFAKSRIYSISAQPDGTIVVGARSGDVALLDPAGKIERIITTDDGLPGDSISSISRDRQGGIWLTSLTGIGHVDPGITKFAKQEGLKGATLTSVRHHGVFYAGTTAGLFRLTPQDEATPRFDRIAGVPGPSVWSLRSVGNDLLAATDQGLYQVLENQVNPVMITREPLLDVSVSSHRPGTVFVAGRNALYRFQNSGRTWLKTGEFLNRGIKFGTIIEDNDGRVWATSNGAIWRIDFDKIPIAPENFSSEKGVPPGSVNATRVQNHVVFATTRGLFSYNAKTGKFVPDTTLGTEFTYGNRDVVNVFEDHSGNAWVTGQNDHGNKYYGILRKLSSGYRWYPSPLIRTRIDERTGIDEIWWMTFDNDGVAWAAGSDGVLYRWDPALYGDPDRDFAVLTRKAGFLDEPALYGGDGSANDLRVPYRSESLRFEFAAPFYEEPSAVEYQVFLEGHDKNWSLWSHEHSRDYNLRESDYRLHVRARSPHGAVAEESTFAFSVLAPWYRSWGAYGVYTLLACFGVWGIVRWRVRQLEADKHQLEVIVEERTVEIRQQRDEIHVQERKSHSLLLNILPAQVADELKATGSVRPVGFDEVTVCFTDFVGFTVSSEKMPPDGLVNALNEYFTAFDEIISRYRLEKLKTIGDSYMFVSGLPVKRASHAVDAVLAALEMTDVVKQLASKTGGTGWNIRIGLHSGPVIAGVVGIRKFAFDIWGNTVNFAARMESSGVPGRVNMSERTCRLTRELIDCESRGNIRIKEGRELPMFLARGPGDDLAARYGREFGEDPVCLPTQTAVRVEALALNAE